MLAQLDSRSSVLQIHHREPLSSFLQIAVEEFGLLILWGVARHKAISRGSAFIAPARWPTATPFVDA
jgi:hypothetical protein